MSAIAEDVPAERSDDAAESEYGEPDPTLHVEKSVSACPYCDGSDIRGPRGHRRFGQPTTRRNEFICAECGFEFGRPMRRPPKRAHTADLLEGSDDE